AAVRRTHGGAGARKLREVNELPVRNGAEFDSEIIELAGVFVEVGLVGETDQPALFAREPAPRSGARAQRPAAGAWSAPRLPLMGRTELERRGLDARPGLTGHLQNLVNRVGRFGLLGGNFSRTGVRVGFQRRIDAQRLADCTILRTAGGLDELD